MPEGQDIFVSAMTVIFVFHYFRGPKLTQKKSFMYKKLHFLLDSLLKISQILFRSKFLDELISNDEEKKKFNHGENFSKTNKENDK